ncbi:RNA polymerase I-specific transcription initiation factor RRN3 [Culex pipiens pallens]|uniref:RNA polymerase I-specific transcription initiation factor RRN3 n=1 Tax=Culex pipiens pallens TaxID=42434 RepID=UPI00195455B7|nr:RNA polymerase I-specific transcription initiation factor RRN3 [Culex pipiens pallens]
MSVDIPKRRLSSILKPFPNGGGLEGSKLNGSFSQNKVRFDDLAVEAVLQDALQNGQLQRFEVLVLEIKAEQFDDDKFQQVIVESKRCVHLLNANFGMLVEALLSVNWLARNESSREVYKGFVIELLVAQGNYTTLAVSKLVQLFLPRDEDKEGWVRGVPTVATAERFEPVHDLFVRLKNVIPMIFDVILVQLRKQFPYFKRATHVVCGYVYNTLRMTDHSAMFTEELLDIIFYRLVAIDVNTPRNEIEDAEFPDEADDGQIFAMEETPVIEIDDDETMKLPLAETLDCCLETMFRYIEERARIEGGSDRVYGLLLKLFDKHILPTHNTHHVQFLMFYCCSFNQSYGERFIEHLLKMVRNPNISTPTRQAAVGYVASLLARAKYVPMPLLKKTLQDFSDWVHGYLNRSDSLHNQSLKAHLVFYSVCQAIFYVVAFRSKQLTATPKNLAFLQTLQLTSIANCLLNPLRVCVPGVATAFVAVARAHQIAYCNTIMERNERRRTFILFNNGALAPDDCLDTFFPFDPYLLKKSGKRIEPIFLQYQSCEAEAEAEVLSPAARGRKRYESMSEDVDDFIQEVKRHKGHGGDPAEMQLPYSYGVSPGFHS